MKRATSSYRPRLDLLESRLQPGSVFAGALELSVLAGGFALLGPDLFTPPGRAADEAPALAAPDTKETARFVAPVPVAEFAPPARLRPVVLATAFEAVPGASVAACLNAAAGPLKPPSGGGHILDDDSCLVNGDFETGDLEGWEVGNPDDRLIGVDDFNPLSGSYSAYLGTLTEEGNTLAQTCETPAKAYTIAFFLGIGPGTPNSLVVTWGDEVLLELSDAEQADYQLYYFENVPTPNPETTLTFLNRHVPRYWDLDAVIAVPTSE